MSSVALCTDSSALLTDDAARSLGVSVVPVAVAVNGEPFGGDADRFYELLSAGARTTTSQPSPGDLLDAYTRAAARGATEVLSVHPDARLSGTVDTAGLAASESPIPVTVVDTRTASFGVGLGVRAAHEALADGASVGEAARATRRFCASLRNAFVAPAGGARVGSPAGATVLELVEGAVGPVSTAVDVAAAVALISGRVLGSGEPVRVAVGHAGAGVEDAADELVRSVAASTAVLSVERYRIAPAVGAHTGPTSFGAFWWAATS